jgi:hypothetical protein
MLISTEWVFCDCRDGFSVTMWSIQALLQACTMVIGWRYHGASSWWVTLSRYVRVIILVEFLTPCTVELELDRVCQVLAKDSWCAHEHSFVRTTFLHSTAGARRPIFPSRSLVPHKSKHWWSVLCWGILCWVPLFATLEHPTSAKKLGIQSRQSVNSHWPRTLIELFVLCTSWEQDCNLDN